MSTNPTDPVAVKILRRAADPRGWLCEPLEAAEFAGQRNVHQQRLIQQREHRSRECGLIAATEIAQALAAKIRNMAMDLPGG